MLFTLFGALLGVLSTVVVISPVVLLVLLLGTFSHSVGGAIVLFLVVFLNAYGFAVVSGYLYHFLLWAIGAVAPNRGTRHAGTWVLSLVYLLGTLLFFGLVIPFSAGALGRTLTVLPTSIGIGLTALLPGVIVHFVVALVVYMLADASAPTTPGGSTPGESAWRGFLIGMNAVVNGLLAFVVSAAVLQPALQSAALGTGIAVGGAAFVLSLLATVHPTGVAWIDTTLRVVIGWTSWLMPMSWVTVTLGWLLFLVNVLGHLFAVRINPWWGLFAIDDGIVDLATGTCMTEGGLASNVRFQGWPQTLGMTNAYDLGTFSYQHGRLTSTTDASGFTTAITATGATFLSGIAGGAYNTHLHESGHNLNLAALGSWFHVFNAIDENLFWYDPTTGAFVGSRGQRAYAERLAESNRKTGVRWILFW